MGVCQNCLLKFNEYDELVSRAEAIQLDLTNLLLETRNTDAIEEQPEDEIKIKDENDDDTITFEPIYFESIEGPDDEIEPLLNDYQMEVVVDSKENFGEPSHATRKGLKMALNTSFKEKIEKQDDYVVVELDNKRRGYQCDICSKTFKDRSKLKSHKEIHTTERNVVCKVCLHAPV